jgi:hypothetical protein
MPLLKRSFVFDILIGHILVKYIRGIKQRVNNLASISRLFCSRDFLKKK